MGTSANQLQTRLTAWLVLDAAYETTICTANLKWPLTEYNRIFLTLLGGGVFGNEIAWIINSINRAL